MGPQLTQFHLSANAGNGLGSVARWVGDITLRSRQDQPLRGLTTGLPMGLETIPEPDRRRKFVRLLPLGLELILPGQGGFDIPPDQERIRFPVDELPIKPQGLTFPKAQAHLEQNRQPDVGGLNTAVERYKEILNARRREILVACSDRGRQTRMMLEAKAFVPIPIDLPSRSVRIGHVPVRASPARRIASKKVSHPVDEVPDPTSVSDCLNA